MCMCTTPNRANCAAFLSPINAGPESLIPQGSDPSAVFYPLLSLRRGLDSVTTWGHFFLSLCLLIFLLIAHLLAPLLLAVLFLMVLPLQNRCVDVCLIWKPIVFVSMLWDIHQRFFTAPLALHLGSTHAKFTSIMFLRVGRSPDERTEEEREAESIRTSVSRSVRMVRELAACNQWQFLSL